VEGLSKFYTPEEYGGGKKVAALYFEKAATYFKTQTVEDVRKPFWGNNQNIYYLNKCKE
jgi:hypothetical protein